MRADHRLYRNQFIAGARAVMPAEDWNISQFGADTHLTSHPSQCITRAMLGATELLCIGHILDSGNPSADNSAVLSAMAQRASSFAELEYEIAKRGGRFVLFARIAGESRVYPDASATLSVYVMRAVGGEIWLASQPNLFRRFLDAPFEDALCEHFRMFKTAATWPLDLSPVPRSLKLLPNHFVDIRTGEIRRFWPTKPLAPIDMSEAAERIYDGLSGFIDACAARWRIKCGLSGGYDSRAIFAGSMRIRGALELYTVAGDETPLYDIHIPRALARKHNLRHQFYRSQSPSAELATLLQENTAGMTWDPSLASAGAYKFSTNAMAITGITAENLRAVYFKFGQPPQPLEPDYLCRVAKYAGSEPTRRAFARWLDSAPRDMSVHPLELFFWEHRTAGWGSIQSTAWDTVQNLIHPFNSHELFELGLRTDLTARLAPYPLFQRIIEIGAPKALRYPFNSSLRTSAEDFIASHVSWRLSRLVMRGSSH